MVPTSSDALPEGTQHVGGDLEDEQKEVASMRRPLL